MKTKDFLICFAIAKQLAYRALRPNLSDHFKIYIRQSILDEILLIRVLKEAHNKRYSNQNYSSSQSSVGQNPHSFYAPPARPEPQINSLADATAASTVFSNVSSTLSNLSSFF